MVLRRQYRQLREELAKLPVPEGIEGLEQFDHPFSANITMTTPANSATTSENSQSVNAMPTTSAETLLDKEMEIVEIPADTPGSPDKEVLNEVFKSSLKNLNDFMAAEAKILDSSILDEDDDTDEFLNESALDTLIDDVMKTHKKLDMVQDNVEDISE
jgi:hypothetical protein